LLIALFCRKQAAGSGPSNSAPNSTYSKCSPFSTLEEWSLSENQRICLEKDTDKGSLFVEGEGVCFPRLSDAGDAKVTASHIRSLQQWAHDTGGFHQLPSNDCATISHEEFDKARPSLSGQNTGVDLFIVNSDEASPRQAYGNDPSSARDQQQIFERKTFSTYTGLQEEPQCQSWTVLTSEHLQASFIDYQLGIWAYSTMNTEITLTERMEKANWECSCLERL
jgi:hypothetical protein